MTAAATLWLGVMLALLTWHDLREFRLPDRYTLPLIMTGLAYNAAVQGGLPVMFVWGAIAGFALFWIIGALHFRLRGREGLGLGDAKLLSGAGAWLGLGLLAHVVLIAAVGALVCAIWQGDARGRALAFGPWLAGAFWLVWLGILTGLPLK